MSKMTRPACSTSRVLTVCAILCTPSTAGLRTSAVTSQRQPTLCPPSIAMLFRSAGSMSPTSTNLPVKDGTTQIPFQCCHIPLFWLETSIATTQTGAMMTQTLMVTSCKAGHHVMTSTLSMTPNSEVPFTQHDGSVTTPPTCVGYQQPVVTPNQPRAQSWTTSPTANTAHL